MKAIRFIFILAVAAILFLSVACTTIYEPAQVPEYAELQLKFDTSAQLILYPSPWKNPLHDQILLRKLHQHNYTNIITDKLIPANLKELKADHIIQLEGILCNTLKNTNKGACYTLMAVVMIRPPGIYDDFELKYENPRYFKAYLRFYRQEYDSSYNPMEQKNIEELLDNLFRNPKFREALSPRK